MKSKLFYLCLLLLLIVIVKPSINTNSTSLIPQNVSESHALQFHSTWAYLTAKLKPTGLDTYI